MAESETLIILNQKKISKLWHGISRLNSKMHAQNCYSRLGEDSKEEEVTSCSIKVTWIAATHTWWRYSEQNARNNCTFLPLCPLCVKNHLENPEGFCFSSIPKRKGCKVRTSEFRMSMTLIWTEHFSIFLFEVKDPVLLLFANGH